jgi:ABC-type bacteriocin/lantibiotic exporter with double-glycine peptidase domain
MPGKPPYFPQETDFSCAQACLRMVLAALGETKTEEELRELSGYKEGEGTDSLDLAEAARSLGFFVRRGFYLSLDDLQAYIQEKIYPIVYLHPRLIPSTPAHSVVVIGIAVDEVHLLDPDPENGECTFPKNHFWREWTNSMRMAILVEKE